MATDYANQTIIGDLNLINGDTVWGTIIVTGNMTLPAGVTIPVQKYTGSSPTAPWTDTGNKGYVIIDVAGTITIDGILTAEGQGYLGGNGGHGGEGRTNSGLTNGSNGIGYDNNQGLRNSSTEGGYGGYDSEYYNTESYPSNYREIQPDEDIRQRLRIGGGGSGGDGGDGASGAASPNRSFDSCDETVNVGGGYAYHNGGGGGGAGASGGGYIKLFAAQAITINGLVSVKGGASAGNGTAGGEFSSYAPNKKSGFGDWNYGTWYSTSRWPGNGRAAGGAGGDASLTGVRAGGSWGGINNWWAVRSPSNRRNAVYDPDSECHQGRKECAVWSNGDSGYNGGYGGPGGILIHSYGPISIPNSSSLDLQRGDSSAHDGLNNTGGTLKIFYTTTDGWTTVSADDSFWGVLYTELAYNGYPPSGFDVTPLTGADPKFDNNNIFEITWNEGLGFQTAPSGVEIIHNGFKVFRNIGDYGNASSPDPSIISNWTEIATVNYSASTGGDHITTPYTFEYNDDISSLSQTIRNQIFYTQRRLDYLVYAYFNVGGTDMTPVHFISGHPAETLPELKLIQAGIQSTPQLIDGSYWDNRIEEINESLSGYDDFLVSDEAQTYWGSFQVTGWNWNFDDKAIDLGGNTNNYAYFKTQASRVWPGALSAKNTSVDEEYTYHDPSINGLSGARFTGFPGTDNGYFTVVASASANTNVYDNNADVNTIDSKTVTVFERPPTPTFYPVLEDLPDSEGRTYPSRLGNNGVVPIYSPSRIVFGVSPLSSNFVDYSLSRTWPISSWEIEYVGNTRFSPVTYTHILPEDCNQCIDPAYADKDSQLFRYNFLSGYTYIEPGLYRPTLTVETSNSHVQLSAYREIHCFAAPLTADFNISGGASNDLITIEEFVPIHISALNISLSGHWPVSAIEWNIYDSYKRTEVTTVCSMYSNFDTPIKYDWKWHTQTSTYNIGTVDNSLTNICLIATMSASQGYLDDFEGYPLSALGNIDTKCVHLLLKEKDPVANFEVLSAKSVTSTYTADDPVVLYNVTIGSLISGYSPNLTLNFMDSSVPKSYPISSYSWSFGDYYNDFGQTSAFEVSQLLSGWYSDSYDAFGSGVYPSWTTDVTNNETQHTYVMPGWYTATLTVQASTTETESVCSQLIYLEEIYPGVSGSCGFESRLATTNWSDVFVPSGSAPLTVFFNATGIIPGSFQIGQIDWDFGDGSDIYSVERWPDNVDPRDEVIEHTFYRPLYTDSSTFTVTISVYADRTNSMITCSGSNWTTSASGYNIGPIKLPRYGNDGEKNKHLIKSRMYNNNDELLLVFENDAELRTHAVLLSGE